ncbi:MAG: hypothetical protein ACYTBJ_01470 [Planctomycetota bacterium]|jgi:hypothetical protein
MEKTAGRILKGNNVRIEGRMQLGVTHTVIGPQEANCTASTPAVAVVQNHPEFVVIEFTCSCGAKTFVKCEYGHDNTQAENHLKQNGISGAPHQAPQQKEQE